jgi:hypothetical protein
LTETIARRLTNATFFSLERHNTLPALYGKAKKQASKLQRKRWVQVVLEYSAYLALLCFVYFVLVGRSFWKGAVWWLYWIVKTKFVVTGGWSVILGIAFL